MKKSELKEIIKEVLKEEEINPKINNIIKKFFPKGKLKVEQGNIYTLTQKLMDLYSGLHTKDQADNITKEFNSKYNEFKKQVSLAVKELEKEFNLEDSGIQTLQNNGIFTFII